MIQARKLGHVVLKVRDARTSKEFYTRALGLRVAHEDYDRGAVFLSFGTQHHDLALRRGQLAQGSLIQASPRNASKAGDRLQISASP